MRKVKGIMINGEWLGEKVAINSVFRAICAISPIIVQEFVHQINKLDNLAKPVTLSSFEFADKDEIRLNFSNSELSGSADLTFAFSNNELKLVSSILDIQSIVKTPEVELKDETSDIKSIVKESHIATPKIAEVIPESFISEITDDISNFELKTDLEEVKTERIIQEKDFPLNQPDSTTEAELTPVQESETEPEEELTNVVTDKHPEIKVVEEKEELIQKVIEHTSTIESPKPIVIEVVQTPPQPVIQEVVVPVIKQDSSVESVLEKTEAPAKNVNLDFKTVAKPDDAEDFSSLLAEDISPTVESKISEILDNKNIESESFVFEEDDDFAKIPNTELDITDLKAEIENLKESEVLVENTPNEASEPSLSVSIEELDDNEAKDCLLSMYLEASSESKEMDSGEKVKSTTPVGDFMMQAVLAEMVALKEELDVLKAEPAKRITAEEFFGPTENNLVIKDEDADFKIWSSTDKINAAILDEECFIAGEKLYRWGDTLYLED